MKRTTFLKRTAAALLVMTMMMIATTTAWAEDEVFSGSYFTVTGGTGGTKESENYDKLMDYSVDTKWCITDFNGCYIEFEAEMPFIPTAYYLCTANDTQSNSGRNPKDWVLKAKKNFADNWTTLATVTNDNVLQAQNKQDYKFELNNTENYYRYFRFEVSAVKSGSTFQLSELVFTGRDKKNEWEPGFDPTQWIQDVMLVGGSQSEVNAKIATYQSQGWTVNEQNLNAGNNGDVIYLLYKLGSTASPSHSFITQIYISDASGDAPTSLNHQGFHYKLAACDGSEDFKSNKGNLNNGVSGGDQIHLYYTKDKLQSVQAISHIIFNMTQSGAVGKNGSSSTGYDLNNPGKGEQIYMHYLSNTAPDWAIEKSTDGSLCYVKGFSPSDQSKLLVIPAIIEDAAVVGISGVNFSNYIDIETIYFSQSYNASSIPSANSCYKLKHIHIVDNSGTVVNADELPASVTSLVDYAFCGTSIETLKMPNVTSIASGAFNYCGSLTSVTMPKVTSIGENAFKSTALTGVTLPSGLTIIGNEAFYYCEALTSITIPSSVTNIGNDAFKYCNNLTEVTIKGNPTMGEGAFPDGTTLKLEPRTNVGGGASWTTFYNDRYNFKAVHGWAKVYKATVSGGLVCLTEVADKIVNAGTAVVLKTGEKNNYVQLNRTTDASTDTQPNDLHGLNTRTRIENLLAGDYAGCTFYLPTYEGGMGYDRYSGDQMSQNTAFLALQQGALTPTTMPAVEVVTLADNSSNSTTLAAWAADGKTRNVMLLGRTLYKDNEWNTLCLPFNLSDLSGTPLEGATLMELGNSSGCDTGFNDQNGILSLDFVSAGRIEAGHAYIVKWETTGEPISNPVFQNVTIINENPDDQKVVSADGTITFRGTYDYRMFSDTDQSILFLGEDDKLYYPESGARIGAFRAYFQLNGITVGNLPTTAIQMHFGDGDATGMEDQIVNSKSSTGKWFDLAGRRIDGVPAAKGIYIKDGKKIIVK